MPSGCPGHSRRCRPADRVIVFGNHPSWWDPALYIVLANELFRGRPGFGPMDRESLARYGFFRRLGIFGIDKGSAAGARRFLDVARRVLASQGERGRAMIWVTGGRRIHRPEAASGDPAAGDRASGARGARCAAAAARDRIRVLERKPPRAAAPLRGSDRSRSRHTAGRVEPAAAGCARARNGCAGARLHEPGEASLPPAAARQRRKFADLRPCIAGRARCSQAGGSRPRTRKRPDAVGAVLGRVPAGAAADAGRVEQPAAAAHAEARLGAAKRYRC